MNVLAVLVLLVAQAQVPSVQAEQKISPTAGGFTGPLVDFNLFGCAVGALGDLDGDGVGDLVVGAWHDDDGGVDSSSNTGAVWILFLEPDGTVKAEQKISALAGGFTGPLAIGDHFGGAAASIGDLDGDGVTDIVVGAWHDQDGGGPQRGAVYVLFLDADGTVAAEQKISSTAGGFTGTLANQAHFGTSLAHLGDLDGDGLAEVAVGARGAHDETDPGAVWILFLAADGTVRENVEITAGSAGFTGALGPGDFFGQAVAGLGDLDDDGVPDLAVGAYQDDDGGPDRGATWILLLNADGSVKAHRKISATAGGLTASLDDVDRFGSALSALGDLDGDGVRDLAVGALTDDDGGVDCGAIHLLSLAADGSVQASAKLSAASGGFGGTLDPGDQFGQSIAPVGDLDGDGVLDLAVGAWFDDDGGFAPIGNTGAVWMLFLDAAATAAWDDLGLGLAGTGGVPTLVGEGALAAGTPLSLTLSGALPGSTTALVVGVAALEAPFKGGTLVPAPTLLVAGLPTGPAGTLVLNGVWPPGVPPGTTVLYQHWVADPAAAKGLAASNGLAGTSR